MKKRINKWWWRYVIYPYLMKHQADCTVALRNAIVYQCWYGGMKFNQINKWLSATKQDTIKAYAIENGKPRIFYDVPTIERRKEIKGQVVIVPQN